MKTYIEFENALRLFINEYRKSSLPELILSDFYDLFPKEKESIDVVKCGVYPQQFPFAQRSGVYVIFDGELNVLYIGKASFGNTIGIRLSSYFYGENDCLIPVDHKWTEPGPRYIKVIVVPENYVFEAAAIEEYLITALQPPDNTIGVKQDAK